MKRGWCCYYSWRIRGFNWISAK